TYTYDTGVGGVDDGDYVIRTNPQDALSNFFNTADHTTDPAGVEGYMLIVNADFSTGEFYRRQVTGLCEGQTFEFSAYLMNILPSTDGCNPNVPNNVIFRVEDGSGGFLGEVATGNINATASPEWVRYSFDFEVGVGVTEVEIVLINNAPGGCGNDLAIDDISFRACSSLTTVNTNYAD